MVMKLVHCENHAGKEDFDVYIGEQADSLLPCGEIRIPEVMAERFTKALSEAYGAERNWTFFNGAIQCVATPVDKLVVTVESK